MAEIDDIQRLATGWEIELTEHAVIEARAEDISVAEIRDVLMDGIMLENYPEH